jgi:type VI protein secretion system component VasK
MAEPMGGLSASLQQVLDEARSLRTDVKAAERARRRESQINLVIIGVLAVFVLLVGVVTWQNNQVIRQTQQTNDTIADCTSPAGECYKSGQRRTAAVVEDLIRASTFVAQCARLRPGESGPEFDAFLEQCVAEKLGLQPGPSPSPTLKVTPTPVP